MPNYQSFRKPAFYALVFFSGASALIYEVVWHRYLSILLGAQARATAVVLAVFLGGISAGYFLFGRWTRRARKSLPFAYAVLELGIGIWGAAFPWLYLLASKLAGTLYSTFGITSLWTDIVLAIGLIGAPTMMMGGTLPLLTQGLGDRDDEASRTHARLYGWNTVGGFLGCLLAGYLWIPNEGLVITSYIAAAINVSVAIAAWCLRKEKLGAKGKARAKKKIAHASSISLTSRQHRTILGVGFGSGFVLITLQMLLIRLAGLSVGSSNYTFTLIVSIYVLALGSGSLIANRFGHYNHRHLIFNLIASAFLFGLVYRSGDYWSYGAHVMRVLLRDIDQSFYLYQGLLAGACFLVLFSPLAIAGLTLPLCFHLLRGDSRTMGWKVGQLYGANTIGCVCGAVFGGYVVLHWFNLDQVLRASLYVWPVAAIALAWAFGEFASPKRMVAGRKVLAAFAIATLVLNLLAQPYDKDRFIQPFRHSSPNAATFEGASAFGRFLARNSKLVLWQDGPNTSLGVGSTSHQGHEISRSIFINGKSDGNTGGDLFTVQMLAQVPGFLARSVERACVIGFGTGITAGSLARFSENKQVDVLEISGTVIEHAKEFDAYNYAASQNPKIKLHEMDAFRFFAGSRNTYDLILSEPSNPWVTGIENLYTTEFYGRAIHSLAPTGLFVQWLHTYSFSEDLLRLVLRTMQHSFAYVSAFQFKSGDIALVASNYRLGKEDIIRGNDRLARDPEILKMLTSVGIDSPLALIGLEYLTPEMTRNLAGSGPIHTLSRPRLSQPAARAFFRDDSVPLAKLRRGIHGYLGALENSLLAQATPERGLDTREIQSLRRSYCDHPTSRSSGLCQEVLSYEVFKRRKMENLARYEDFVSLREISSLQSTKRPASRKFTESDLEDFHRRFEAYKRIASPIDHLPASAFLEDIQRCLTRVQSSSELYGECLLQKVILIESIAPRSAESKTMVRTYLDWFPRLSSKSKSYQKLLEAKNILSSMN